MLNNFQNQNQQNSQYSQYSEQQDLNNQASKINFSLEEMKKYNLTPEKIS